MLVFGGISARLSAPRLGRAPPSAEERTRFASTCPYLLEIAFINLRKSATALGLFSYVFWLVWHELHL